MNLIRVTKKNIAKYRKCLTSVLAYITKNSINKK